MNKCPSLISNHNLFSLRELEDPRIDSLHRVQELMELRKSSKQKLRSLKFQHNQQKNRRGKRGWITFKPQGVD